MSKIITCFGASNSKNSINKKLATFAASQINDTEINSLDLNDFSMPLFCVDLEATSGIPQEAHSFKAHMAKSDGIIISFAEHNGAYSTAFKNIFDWASRIGGNIWAQKPLFLMATSPGARGGTSVLDIAINRLSFGYENHISTFSLPLFNENFSEELGITDLSLKSTFEKELNNFKQAVFN